MKTIKNLSGYLFVIVILVIVAAGPSKWLWENKSSTIKPTLTEINYVQGVTDTIQKQLNSKVSTADLVTPTSFDTLNITAKATAPTMPAGTNTTDVATTAFVQGEPFAKTLLRDNTAHSVVNSNVETTVYTGTIPANTLTNGGTLVFKALFTMINSANQKTFRVKINGTDVGSYGTTTAVSFLGVWHLFLRSGNTQISQSPASSSSNAFSISTVGTKSDYNFNYTSDLTVTVSISMASSSETSALQSFSCVWEK